MFNVLMNTKDQYFVLCCLVTDGYEEIYDYNVSGSHDNFCKKSAGTLKKSNKQNYIVGSSPLQQAFHKYRCGLSESKQDKDTEVTALSSEAQELCVPLSHCYTR